MNETDIIGQARVKNMLTGALDSGRVSHAYLFHGQDGVGKRAMALAFSASLLCKSRSTGFGCGTCSACDRATRLIHPDVHFLLPAPGDTKDDALAERLQLLGRNPYSTVDFERKPVLGDARGKSRKRVIYSVERIHSDVHRALSFTAVEGGYRIVVLTDADRLVVQAANALLKILEEPRERTVLILTTDQPDLLLPTIRSRCQSVRFDRLSDDEIADALENREELESASASTFARMSDGSYSRALELAHSPDLVELRLQVISFLRVAYTCKGPDVVKVTEELQRVTREQLRFFYQLMLLWLRDILLQRTLGESAPLVNLDQKEEIIKFARNLPEARIEHMIEAVEEAHRLVDRNVNPRLGVIVLVTKLSDAMRGKSGIPLVTALSEE